MKLNAKIHLAQAEWTLMGQTGATEDVHLDCDLHKDPGAEAKRPNKIIISKCTELMSFGLFVVEELVSLPLLLININNHLFNHML